MSTAPAEPAEPPRRLNVEVAYSPRAGEVDAVALELPAGATLADALHASGLLERHGLSLEGLPVGVWSRVQPIETLLRDRDRVEIYRALLVDPKEARRQRYRKQRDKVGGRAGAAAAAISADRSEAAPANMQPSAATAKDEAGV